MFEPVSMNLVMFRRFPVCHFLHLFLMSSLVILRACWVGTSKYSFCVYSDALGIFGVPHMLFQNLYVSCLSGISSSLLLLFRKLECTLPGCVLNILFVLFCSGSVPLKSVRYGCQPLLCIFYC